MGDSTPASNFLSDLSAKDKRWDSLRAFADQVKGNYDTAGYQKYALRVDNCSRWLEFLVNDGLDGKDVYTLSRAIFCRVRFCPVCQWRRSLKWRARFLEALPAIAKDYPKHRWLFLTLTLRNCPVEELRATIESMNKAFTRLSKLKAFPAVGWVKSLEVTRSATGEAHPHFHCLLLVPSSYFGHRYLKQSEWAELWRQSLRVDYTPVVDIRTVKLSKELTAKEKEQAMLEAVKDGFTEELVKDKLKSLSMVKAVCETLKYSIKPKDLSDNIPFLKEITKQLHKTRSVAIGGVLRDYLKDVKDDDDLIHLEENKTESENVGEHNLILFEWISHIRRYVMMQTENE